jgi:hypothetical protein
MRDHDRPTAPPAHRPPIGRPIPSVRGDLAVTRVDAPMPPSTATDRGSFSAVRLAALVALGLAAALLALWLWSRFCRFPSIPWNDMRLAPTIALAQGWPVYPDAASGTINTWMYGPLPVLCMWPAAWAGSAAGALLIAAGLTLVLTLAPIALVCGYWQAGDAGTGSRPGRTAAALLCLAAWPELHYSVIFSDNLAVACGLVANLVLLRARGAGALWLAAAVATAAVACKQIALGIPLAQVLWLGLTAGRRAALSHAARCTAAGAVLGLGAIAIFGFPGLWFTLVAIPGGLGWAPDVALRLKMVAPELALLLGVPAAVMVIWRREFARPGLLLPALAWLCTLPLGVAGMMKVGGWTNSLHGFVLWLPPVLTTLFSARWSPARFWSLGLAAGVIAAASACARIALEPDVRLRPQIAGYEEAAEIAAQYRNAIWFPVHPLVTLYSDHRYYHDEDGMYVHARARKPVTPEQAAQHLPPAMRAMAFRNDWTDWGIARRMLPPNSREIPIGRWLVYSGVNGEKKP